MDKRFNFIDLFRGWAVIIMVETHALNAWMDAGFRNSDWFSYLNFVNGFVAPSFLFVSGVSFALGLHLKSDSLSHWTPAVFRQLRRLVMIMGIGYMLHIPRFDLDAGFPFLKTEDLAEFFLSDVLHTIALSLIILQVLLLLMRSPRKFAIGVAILSVMALFGTPHLWRLEFGQYLHPAFANYLNGMHNPLFPLFPWCIFAWAGAVTGVLFFRNLGTSGEAIIIQRILQFGVVIFVLAFFSDRSPITLFSYDNFWLTSPNWVLMRLGVLMILFGFFWLLDVKQWHTSKFVLFIGGQSLFIYIVHLTVIYTFTGHKATFPLLEPHWSPVFATLFFVILLFSVYGLTKGWVLAKKRFFPKKSY